MTDALMVAAKLQEAHEVTRRLLGPRFDAQIRPIAEQIARIAEWQQQPPLIVATNVAKAMIADGGGSQVMFVLAAAVEIAEGRMGDRKAE